MARSDVCASGIHAYCENWCDCECHEKDKKFAIDKETAEELLQFIGNQFVNHKYTKVHKLIRDLWVFVGKK